MARRGSRAVRRIQRRIQRNDSHRRWQLLGNYMAEHGELPPLASWGQQPLPWVERYLLRLMTRAERIEHACRERDVVDRIFTALKEKLHA